MNNNILYLENLDHAVTEEHLENLFSAYGDVNRIMVRKNRGFVEMMSSTQAKRVQKNLDGEILWGRPLKIKTMDSSFLKKMLFFSGIFLL